MIKHAFKLGFVAKLAELGITPDQLVARATKVAGKGKPKSEAPNQLDGDDEGGPPEMSGAMRSLLVPASGAIGLALVGPQGLGRVAGGVLAKGLADQMDTTDELRKRYLIKRYRDFMAERVAQRENKLISEALHG